MFQNKKIIYAVTIFIFIFLLIFMFFLTKSPKGSVNNPSPTPIPVPTDFNIDYSKLNLLAPGKSTLGDVEKISGVPSLTSTLGDKTILYYKTPSADYQNIVVLQNGVVDYAVENIFGNYRGTLENYTSSLGQYNIVLYQPPNPYTWYIFLKRGIGVQSAANGITAFLYFVPQTQDAFMNGIGKDLGFSLGPGGGPPRGESFNPAL